MAELNFFSVNKIGEAYTENYIGHREYVFLKCWYRSDKHPLTDEVCNAIEVHAKQPLIGKVVASQRSSQAVACIKRCIENLRDPKVFHKDSGREIELKARSTMTLWKSDLLIVVRDGKADHMAKGQAVIVGIKQTHRSDKVGLRTR